MSQNITPPKYSTGFAVFHSMILIQANFLIPSVPWYTYIIECLLTYRVIDWIKTVGESDGPVIYFSLRNNGHQSYVHRRQPKRIQQRPATGLHSASMLHHYSSDSPHYQQGEKWQCEANLLSQTISWFALIQWWADQGQLQSCTNFSFFWNCMPFALNMKKNLGKTCCKRPGKLVCDRSTGKEEELVGMKACARRWGSWRCRPVQVSQVFWPMVDHLLHVPHHHFYRWAEGAHGRAPAQSMMSFSSHSWLVACESKWKAVAWHYLDFSEP